jgi:tRNA(Arg) A34 adenosine deaminase TadA
LSSQKQYFTLKTYDLAKQAALKGNHPFGALATLDDKIIASATNLVITQNDSTKHAELILASFLSQNHPRSMIEHMTIYCSTEPCTMCAAALFWIGCRHIIFGCSVDALSRHTSKSFSVSVRESLCVVANKVKIEGPILENEGEEIHMNFWHRFGGKK